MQQTFAGMEQAVKNIELDKLIERIIELLPLITTGPWKADTTLNIGKNWNVANLGASSENEMVYMVTTDHVPCSEYDGDAKYDAEFIALVRNNIAAIIERLKQ